MQDQEVVCLKKNQSVKYEVNISPHHHREHDLDAVEFCLDPVKVAIARLSDHDIRRLNDFDLVDLLRLSGVFSPREWTKFLRFMENSELRMMAFLARRFCRQELNSAYHRRGRQSPFAND